MTRKAKTDLMALAILNQWSVFNSLLRSDLSLDDDETRFPGCCIIVHQKYKILNLRSKLSSCMGGVNGDDRSKISSALRSVLLFGSQIYRI